MTWAEEEFKTADLGDKRLNKRLILLTERLAESPMASIPDACSGWAEVQGAYRFLAQEEIGWEDVMTPHFECSRQRMASHGVVLCIQDTTELDFNGQQIEGLGKIRGQYMHFPIGHQLIDILSTGFAVQLIDILSPDFS